MRVTVKEDASLRSGAMLCPVVGGTENDAACLKVETNPATPDGSWPVTTAGTEVAVTSLQGGNHVNLSAGTRLNFDEELPGATAILSSAMAGGSQLESFGALRQVKLYKDLGNQIDAKSFFAAQVRDYPAAVLTWAATTPGDGSVSPALGADGTRVSRGKRIYAHEWTLFVISSRLDSKDRRKREGDVLRDDILEMLTDRESFRGVPLSNPNGIKVIDARLASTTSTAYVDVIRFVTWFILKRTDSRTFNDWKTSSITVPPTVGDRKPIDDARFSMVVADE
jgi:hypothetical protein